MTRDRIKGVLAPVITPFTDDLAPDADRLARHCKWLIENDVGLAVFGTNSEANSLSVGEKLALLDHLAAAGLPGARMMPGTGHCALTDTVALTKKAMEIGCGGVLMLPPFFYKGVTDDGLFASFSEVIQRVGDPDLRIYLYHIPQMSGVPITLTLIERLLKEYPGVIAGAKDSSGKWENTHAMLTEFGPQGFDVFSGSESFLLEVLRLGGGGCISATANVNPAPMSRLARTWQQDDADAQQAALDEVRNIFQGYVLIPAMKSAVARAAGDPGWQNIRPPLMQLPAAEAEALEARLAAIGFSMPGLPVREAA